MMSVAARQNASRRLREKAQKNCPAGQWISLDGESRACDECGTVKPPDAFGKRNTLRRNSVCRVCIDRRANTQRSSATTRRYERTTATNDERAGTVRVGKCPICRMSGVIAFVPFPGGLCGCGWRIIVGERAAKPKKHRVTV